MFAQESKYLKRELEAAGKDVSAWAAQPLSFEGEGKANLGAFYQPLRGLGNATSCRPASFRSLHVLPAPFSLHPCCLA